MEFKDCWTEVGISPEFKKMPRSSAPELNSLQCFKSAGIYLIKYYR